MSSSGQVFSPYIQYPQQLLSYPNNGFVNSIDPNQNTVHIQEDLNIGEDIEIYLDDDCFSIPRATLSFSVIAQTVGLRLNEVEKISYKNVSNKRKYTVLASNPDGIQMVVDKGDKITVFKRTAKKRKSRPSEVSGQVLKSKSKDRFTKLDYVQYFTKPEHVRILTNMRSRVSTLFGSDEAKVIVMNRITSVCPFKHCQMTIQNDIGGNIGAVLKHIYIHHPDTESGKVLLERWREMKESPNSQPSSDYDLSQADDMKLPPTKKDYAEAPDSTSAINVFKVLQLLERPSKPLRSTPEPKLKADKEVVRVARIMTHGMRSLANRAIHKPSAFYPPTQVGFSEMDLRANIEPSDEIADNFDDITGLHICFAELEDGTTVARDDWVAFSFGPKLLIGVYKKSIGYKSLIDSTAILGDNLFGWPCHCNNTDYHPMVSCQNSACTDISFIETKNIFCRFNCPVLTRRGFKIPNAVQKLLEMRMANNINL